MSFKNVCTAVEWLADLRAHQATQMRM